jgi:hypothetical protein
LKHTIIKNMALTPEQQKGLQSILDEAQARKLAGTPDNQARIPTPAVITSKIAKDLTTQNQNYLGNIEAGYTQPIGGKKDVKTGGFHIDYDPNNPTIVQPPQTGPTIVQDALNVQPSATNPAQNQLVNNINQTIANLTPEQRKTALTGAVSELLNRINQSSDQELVLTSKAREAEQDKDYSGLNEATKALKASQQQRIKDLEELQKQIAPLRQQLMATYTPSADEMALSKEIADLQESMKQFDLDTQRAIYGLEGQGRGIISGIISGQQAKLQQQRALEYQSMAAKEANLLTRLGLMQDARKAQQSALTTGIGLLADDYELQTKIQDLIDEQNIEIVKSAQELPEQAKDMLTFILKQFEGIDYDALPEESKSAIQALAEQSGIDIGLIRAGLKAVKDQQDFDNALKLSQEKRLSEETKTTTKDKEVEKQEKQIENFRKDASDLIEKLDKGDITWGTAFDKLKAKYPEASNELIDQTLGGGYDPETGTWIGRAK